MTTSTGTARRPCRNGRHVATLIFITDGKLVFLFVEKAGDDLTLDDPNAKAFFGSVEFTPK
ncbi:MAG TPA: hypothetical protein VGJ05_18420 [Fimbriiglobus sp.]